VTAALLTDVIIAARAAESTLPAVLGEIPSRLVRSVVVVDYGSRDATAQVAHDAGAVVLREARGGYGAACNRAVAHVAALPRPSDVVVVVAADGSDDPGQLARLIEPIANGDAELVLGTRGDAHGLAALRDRVALGLIGAIYRHRFDDLGTYVAIRLPALVALGLRDGGAGWNVELKVRALCLGLHIAEVPVTHRPSGAPVVSSAKQAWRGLGATSRLLFHIVRHSTAR
jgi:glycosyltransferase involved in cell wall biosynthesis